MRKVLESGMILLADETSYFDIEHKQPCDANRKIPTCEFIDRPEDSKPYCVATAISLHYNKLFLTTFLLLCQEKRKMP